MSATTKHTCGGPVFGKRTDGCPRCEELLEALAALCDAYVLDKSPDFSVGKELLVARAAIAKAQGGAL